MSLVEWIYLVLTAMPVLVLGLFLIIPSTQWNKTQIQTHPKISVLIALRNEQQNLPALFEALKNLDYPTEKLQILFGNDGSTDKSVPLIADFCRSNPHACWIDIQPTTLQKAKANVLMQLANRAEGDFYFFVDADMRFQPCLLQNYVAHYQPQYGGITGTTLPDALGFWSGFQRIDWGLALGMGADVQRLGHSVTAMGNNMFISKQAYWSTGGYQNLPISVVEDFELYRAIRHKGYGFPILFCPEVLAATKPMHSVMGLLQQRKRWMAAGTKLSGVMQVVLLAQAVYYPVWVVLFIANWPVALVVFSIKSMVQAVYIKTKFNRLKQSISVFRLIFYELYNCIFTCLLLIFYVLPIRVRWKQRAYGSH